MQWLKEEKEYHFLQKESGFQFLQPSECAGEVLPLQHCRRLKDRCLFPIHDILDFRRQDKTKYCGFWFNSEHCSIFHFPSVRPPSPAWHLNFPRQFDGLDHENHTFSECNSSRLIILTSWTTWTTWTPGSPGSPGPPEPPWPVIASTNQNPVQPSPVR